MSDRISEHISLKEAIKSNTATRLGIDNIPREQDLINMKTIAEKVFEPLRAFVAGPIAINSFYRSPELNSAIGGSKSCSLGILSIPEDENRNRCLKAYRENGITKYVVI